MADARETAKPGSDAARDDGCRCPSIDNSYGRGYRVIDGEAQFVIATECPMHGDRK